MYEVEYGDATTKKYVVEAKKFLIWLYDEKGMTVSKISKRIIVEHKKYLQNLYTNPDTINGKLGMNHIFLKFLGIGNVTVKHFTP